MSQEKVLRIWVMPNAGFQTRSILMEELRTFLQYFPHLKVEIEITPWSRAWNRYMELLKHPKDFPEMERPDVVQIGSTWNSTLAYLGFFEELTDFCADIPLKKFVPQGQASCYFPGTERIFSIPWFLDIRVLYYRKDVLKKARVGPEKLERWGDFTEICRTLKSTASNGHLPAAPLAFPGQRQCVLIHDLAPWLWGNGSDFLSQDCKRVLFHREEAFWGIRTYVDFIAQGFMPLHEREGSLLHGNFFTGHAAMQFAGTWPQSTTLNPNHPDHNATVADNLGLALFPSGPVKRSTFLGCSNLAIVKGSHHLREAWALVDYLVSASSQEKHARAIGALPCMLDSYSHFFQSVPEVGRLFIESLGFAQPLPNVLTIGTLEKILERSMEKILKAIQLRIYTVDMLRQEMIQAAAEAEYTLSLYR